MTTEQVEAKCHELKMLQVLITEAEAEADEIRDELKRELGDRALMQAGEYKISWQVVTSRRIDTQALRAEMPDVAAQFTRLSAARRFTVT